MKFTLFKKLLIFSFLCTSLQQNLQASDTIQLTADKHDHLIIVGAGIAAAIESLFAYIDSIAQQIPLKITIFEKNSSVNESPATQIAPSLTPDEIMAVIPRGIALIEKSRILFSLPGGIAVDDVAGITGTTATINFQDQAEIYSLDDAGHAQRTQDLLLLGKMSMELWDQLYTNADDELQAIFKASNFNACYEPAMEQERKLHQGYRIDLIYNVPAARQRAESWMANYESIGYNQCAILSPTEVTKLDPALTQFCQDHATIDVDGKATWHDNAVALLRPGGCLDASVFIPQLYAYLEKKMGTFVDKHGITKNCFQIHCSAQVTNIEFGKDTGGNTVIQGIQVNHHKSLHPSTDDNVTYLFCPGQNVGTLHALGLSEPAYAGFAGAALKLTIDIPQDHLTEVENFNHCMEVHQEGICLAWQARFRNNQIFIAVAGTKAFYADQMPHKDQAFAINRNILQLNMINQVLPEFISWAFGYDTHGKTLTEQDLYDLESAGIAQRWVGLRGVAYDGFPTVGYVYKNDQPVINARCTTQLGSGGVSFAPAVTYMSRAVYNPALTIDTFVQRILSYANSSRSA